MVLLMILGNAVKQYMMECKFTPPRSFCIVASINIDNLLSLLTHKVVNRYPNLFNLGDFDWHRFTG